MNNQTELDLLAVLADAQANDKYLAVSVSDGPGSWGRNGLLWEASEEGMQAAKEYAEDLFCRWMGAREWRIEAHHKREHDQIQTLERKEDEEDRAMEEGFHARKETQNDC